MLDHITGIFTDPLSLAISLALRRSAATRQSPCHHHHQHYFFHYCLTQNLEVAAEAKRRYPASA